jgi:hypothetical protein
VIIIVRTMPRPRKARSSRSAMSVPSTRLTSTTAAVSRTVVKIALRVLTSEMTLAKLSKPANPMSSG